MATKKQVSDLENVVLALEEKVDKMEEEHSMLKQMLSMQSMLIENLQMMMKVMSVSPVQTQASGYRIMQLGGDAKEVIAEKPAATESASNEHDAEVGEDSSSDDHVVKRHLKKTEKKTGIADIRHRMARLV